MWVESLHLPVQFQVRSLLFIFLSHTLWYLNIGNSGGGNVRSVRSLLCLLASLSLILPLRLFLLCLTIKCWVIILCLDEPVDLLELMEINLGTNTNEKKTDKGKTDRKRTVADIMWATWLTYDPAGLKWAHDCYSYRGLLWGTELRPNAGVAFTDL